MLFLNSVRVAPGVRSALAVACGVALSGWAVAQGVDEVEPIVITASRMPQLLQTAPIGASVITSEQMRRAGVSDANEAVRKLGGVAARSDLNGGREFSLDLRGYGSTSEQNLVVLVDGIRLSENEGSAARLSAIALDLIDRIEIVRGGSSVIWGEGASSGVINVILKRAAGDVRAAKVGLAVGSYGARDASASTQLGFGQTVLDASYKRVRSDGFRDNSDYAQDVAAMGLKWADANWRTSLRVQREDQDARLPGAIAYSTYLSNRRRINPAYASDFARNQETRYLANVAYSRGDWTVQLDAGQRVRDNAYVMFGGAQVNASRTMSQLTPRVTYASKLGGTDLKAIAGFDWQGWDFTQPGPDGVEQGSQENKAFFVQSDLSFESGTRLSLGARQERIRKADDFPGNSAWFMSPLAYERLDKLHAAEVGLSQTLAPGWDVYGRLASSYRLPNIDENRATPGNAPLLPQKNADRELGLKWLQGGDSLVVRYFRQYTINEITYVEAPVWANTNLDPTLRQGLELQGQWRLNSALTLSASWQQLTARVRSGANAGKEMVLVAPHSGTARASYQIDEHNSLDVGAQYLAAMRYAADADNMCTTRIPSSLTWDGRYAWTSRDWTFAVAGTNLTDRKGYNYAYSCAATGVYPYEGRSVKFSVSRQF
ncbi:MAG TPA: TonB-dependent receptor [Aquabacterium sp.]|uniref:TonB-dependent receptor n=1 Tax=Aquabacterium sp. TaxID=1872578 RepID=UPI002E2F5F03|nr:TonB-dependent receptor [Aquabacterium sp.]HEX5355605.1 TonB-dependent receptor [Aquabacterium sp.]